MAAMGASSAGGGTVSGGVRGRSAGERPFVAEPNTNTGSGQGNSEQVFASAEHLWYGAVKHMFDVGRTRTETPMTETHLTDRQRQVLEIIDRSMRDRGYPPSGRELGEAVGLAPPATVHSHLQSLEKMGFLRRDPTKPRA